VGKEISEARDCGIKKFWRYVHQGQLWGQSEQKGWAAEALGHEEKKTWPKTQASGGSQSGTGVQTASQKTQDPCRSNVRIRENRRTEVRKWRAPCVEPRRKWTSSLKGEMLGQTDYLYLSWQGAPAYGNFLIGRGKGPGKIRKKTVTKGREIVYGD